jgi:hypothetical protein
VSPFELAALLRSPAAVVRAVRAIDSPALQRLWGWDLSSWTYNAQRGIVFFIHHDTAGEATDVVIAVNAPEGERAAFEPVLGRMSLPARLVCVADDVRR